VITIGNFQLCESVFLGVGGSGWQGCPFGDLGLGRLPCNAGVGLVHLSLWRKNTVPDESAAGRSGPDEAATSHSLGSPSPGRSCSCGNTYFVTLNSTINF